MYAESLKRGTTRTTAVVLRCRIAVVDLDLHAAPGSELRNDDLFRNLPEDSRVGLSPETVVECVEVSGGNDILQVGRLSECQ